MCVKSGPKAVLTHSLAIGYYSNGHHQESKMAGFEKLLFSVHFLSEFGSRQNKLVRIMAVWSTGHLVIFGDQ